MSNQNNNDENNKYMAIDREVYKEIDDFSAEVLDGDELLKYVEARSNRKIFYSRRNSGGNIYIWRFLLPLYGEI